MNPQAMIGRASGSVHTVRFRRLGLALLLSMQASSTTQAQHIEQGRFPDNPFDAGPSSTPALSPPRLLEFAPAEYPEAAAEAGLEGRVELELLVDAEGRVADAKVVVPAGHGFDEAALLAAKRLRFQPATRGEEAIAARVRYPYLFEIQAAPSPTGSPGVQAPVPADLEGSVRSADGDDPLGGALVSLSGDAVSVASIKTAQDGSFAFRGLPRGLYTVQIEAGGYVERFEQEELRSGEATEVIYRLLEAPDDSAYGAVARIPPPPREVTRRSINRTQLTRIPGTRGDALRTVELMPGVARPPLGAGALIVRGSSPQDSQVLLEGLPVLLLYHFGGLTSFFNSHLLQSVEFFPGNFGVRYGRQRGGIVEVNVREPARDRLHGLADINVIDAYAVFEGPITDDWGFAIAGRRSYIDLVFDAVLPEDEFSILAAPIYYDYQAVTTYRPDDDNRLRLMLFGSSDRFALLFAQPADDNPRVDSLDFSTQFHRAHASWYSRISQRTQQDLEVAVEDIDVRFGFGDELDLNLTGIQVFVRSEWRTRVTDNVRFIAGLDLQMAPGHFEYDGPALRQQEGSGTFEPFTDEDRAIADTDYFSFRPAAYFEADLSVDRARAVLGSRVDYYGMIAEASYDPRAVFFYSVADGTSLKAGVGMFTQPPQPQETFEGLGNPNLKPTRTLHASTGVDHMLTEGVSVGLEAFYKHLWDRVVMSGIGGANGFVNDGTGRVFGLELAAKVEPRGRLFGYLSYTLSRSERKDPDGRWRLFDFDQPHILTVASVYRLGAGWELGGTFRLVSGNPYTEVAGAVQYMQTGKFTPVYGAINGARSGAFHRLDVLVRKTWTFDLWKFALYLDVQNVYNRQNPEGLSYDYRYQTKSILGGLPIIPNLGIRGEF